MIASITELRLKNFMAFFKFIPHAIRCKMQADQADGAVSVKVKADGLLIQRTLTVWDSHEAMRAYVRSGAHLKAMKVFAQVANTSYTATFEVVAPPTWDDALKVLKEKGRAIG